MNHRQEYNLSWLQTGSLEYIKSFVDYADKIALRYLSATLC